jgi:putative DNA methylase
MDARWTRLAVRSWGALVLAEVRQELAQSYPVYASWQTLDTQTEAEPRDLILLEPDSGGRTDEALKRLNSDISPAAFADPRKPRWVAKPAVAYLWARTVRCKTCRASIPLLKTRWLCRKDGKRIRLVIQPTPSRDGVLFTIEPFVPVPAGGPAARKAADRQSGQVPCPPREFGAPAVAGPAQCK